MWESENVFAVLVVCIALIAGSVCFKGCSETEKTNREFIKAGYVQEQKQGSPDTYWTKK